MLLLRAVNDLVKLSTKFHISSQLHTFAVESNMNFVLKNICEILSCSDQAALTVYQTFPSIRSVTALSRIKENVELLANNRVSKALIADNPFLLNLEIGSQFSLCFLMISIES